MTSDGGLPAESDARLKGVMGGDPDRDDEKDREPGPGCSLMLLLSIVIVALSGITAVESWTAI